MRARSIKARIIMLVLISSIPGLVIIGILGMKNREHVRSQKELELERIVQLLGHESETLIAGIHQVLFALSHSPYIMDPSSANSILKKIQRENDTYWNIFVINSAGSMIASAIPMVSHNFSDRKYFRDAMTKKQFSAGEFLIGALSKKQLLHFAYPILNKGGGAIGIVGIAVELDTFGKLLSIAKLPEGSIIALSDHAGKRLYRYPDTHNYAGRQDLKKMMHRMGGSAASGTFLETGVDGTERFYVYRTFTLPVEDRPFLYMRVGVPVSRLNTAARREFVAGIGFLLASFLAVLVIAWTFSKLTIGKRFDMVRRASRKFGLGDFSKIDIPEVGDELDELSVVLNSAAEQLEQRERENYEAKTALQSSQDSLRSIYNSMIDAIFIHRRDGSIIDVNDRMLAMYGVTRAEAASLSIIDDYSAPGMSRDGLSVIWKQILEGHAHHFEWLARRPHDGSLFDVEVFLGRITLNGENCILATARDITSRKRSEERLRDSLREKEVLLKEIHHRVKNNLQIISSLLSLQSVHIRDAHMLEVFKDSQTRVQTMALVHQKLYQSDDLSGIYFRDYATELLRDLFRSYGAMANNIQYTIDSDETFLDIDTMVPVGLIISELISNSIKHAFSGRAQGNVSIVFRSGESGTALTVADDGTGLPEGLDIRNAESLGLQLVMTLVEQLEGDLHLANSNGTRITMTMRGA